MKRIRTAAQTIPIIMGEDFSIDPICFVKPAVTQKRASCEIGVLLDCELTCDARRTSKADVRSMQANVCFVPIADSCTAAKSISIPSPAAASRHRHAQTDNQLRFAVNKPLANGLRVIIND